jgi:hypothetical protein
VVTALILKFLGLLAGFAVGLLPTMQSPTWLPTITQYVSDGMVQVGQLGAWIPLEAIRNSAALILGCYVIALAIRVSRMVLSVFTGGGGSAA